MTGKKSQIPSTSLGQISEYERQRLENIKHNAEAMEAQGAGAIAKRILDQKTKFMEQTGGVEEDVDVESSSNYEKEANEADMTGAAQFDDANTLTTEATTTQSTGSKGKNSERRARGPSRDIQVEGEPMFLEFDELDNPIGKWAHMYGRQIGTCVYRVNINVDSYYHWDEVERNKNWEETKRLFNIREPGLAKKEAKVHSLVAARFRNWKSNLRRRWLLKSDALSGWRTCEVHVSVN